MKICDLCRTVTDKLYLLNDFRLKVFIGRDKKECCKKCFDKISDIIKEETEKCDDRIEDVLLASFNVK